MKFLIGIDEAGRGPLAGPVAVGGVLVPHDFDFKIFSFVRDSKQLSPEKRELVFKEVVRATKKGDLQYAVVMVSASIIDRIGIAVAIRNAVHKVLEKLDIDPKNVEVRLDGSLKAPAVYAHQKTIIKGDVTEPAISLASIMAKVTRDRYMVRVAKQYPHYHFEIHKGYGTKLHAESISKFGLSKEHRRSFCKRFL